MKNRLSLFALLLLASLAFAAQSASARSLKQLTYADVIVGHTSYGLVRQYFNSDQQDIPPKVSSIQARNLFTGQSRRLAIPSNYTNSSGHAVAGYGYWADLTGNWADYNIFVTGPKGVRTLPAATPAAPNACPTKRNPMRVTEAGGVVVLEAVFLPRANPGDTSCAIDTAKTNLTLFKADGSAEKLWLPGEYSQWLDQVSDGGWPLAKLLGNRLLLFSRSAWTTPTTKDSFVVLDVEKQKVLLNVTGLKSQLDDVKFSGSNAVLATHWGGAGASTVTRYPLNGDKARLLYKGTLKNFIPMACGTRTLLLPKFGHYRIVGRTGRTLKRIRISRIWPICSSEVAYLGPKVRIYLPSLGR